jgi:hypothetical protein
MDAIKASFPFSMNLRSASASSLFYEYIVGLFVAKAVKYFVQRFLIVVYKVFTRPIALQQLFDEAGAVRLIAVCFIALIPLVFFFFAAAEKEIEEQAYTEHRKKQNGSGLIFLHDAFDEFNF